jgi:hypothetical protein
MELMDPAGHHDVYDRRVAQTYPGVDPHSEVILAAAPRFFSHVVSKSA